MPMCSQFANSAAFQTLEHSKNMVNIVFAASNCRAERIRGVKECAHCTQPNLGQQKARGDLSRGPVNFFR
jgi:hypothetical protein